MHTSWYNRIACLPEGRIPRPSPEQAWGNGAIAGDVPQVSAEAVAEALADFAAQLLAAAGPAPDEIPVSLHARHQETGTQPAVQAEERALTPAAIEFDSHWPGPAGLAGVQVLPVVLLVSPKSRVGSRDGQVQVAFPDGQVQVAFPDGQVQVAFPDGQVQVALPDGQAQVALPDEQVQVAPPDGQVQVALPDEQVQVAPPDGQVQVALPDEQVQVAPPGVFPDALVQSDVLRKWQVGVQDGLRALGGFQVADDQRFVLAPDGAAVAVPVPGEAGSGSPAASVPERGDLR